MSHKLIITAGTLLVFTLLNLIIWQKEDHIAHAIPIKMKLRPADPRSLMQGDYMRLRYDFLDLDKRSLPIEGYLKVTLDPQWFVTKIVLHKGEPLAPYEQLLYFHKKRYGNLHIGAESFMFQEGKGRHYRRATHAVLLLNKEGRTILKDLFIPKQANP